MIDLGQERTWIGSLSARAADDDRLAAQLRWSRAFASADLRAACQPAGSILCVRRVSVAQRGWQSAANRSVDAAMARAERPADGIVLPRAEAVLFRDSAELLACLMRDWAAGRLGAFWWWRLFAGTPPDIARATAVLVRNARAFPHACKLLLRWEALEPVWRRLPEPTVSRALLETFRVFGVAVPAPAAPRSKEESAIESVATQDVALGGSDARAAQSDPPEAVLRLLRRVVWASLPEEGAAGVLALLTLAEAPHIARQPLFLEKAARWIREVRGEPRPPARRGAARAAPAETQQVEVDSEAVTSGPPGIGIAGSPRIADAIPEPIQPEKPPEGRLAEACPREAAERTPPAELQRCPAPAVSPPEPTPALASEEGVETAFAGVFFLLNVAISTGLYADFTEPLTRRTDLSPWDYLALMGLLTAGIDFTEDPIDGVLADLAGRQKDEPPGTEAGAGLEWAAAHAASLAPWLSELLETDDPFQLLVCLRGCVFVSGEQVRVEFPAAAHPLSIRMAGLDRDPGFIPTAGRTVTFRFFDAREARP